MVTLFFITFTSSCFVTKTVASDDIAAIQKKRNTIRIHSEDKIILIKNYRVAGDVLTGEIPENIEEIRPDDIADVYIAPPESVNIDGSLVSVRIINIAKIDYRGHDALSITTGSVLAFLFLVFPGLFAM